MDLQSVAIQHIDKKNESKSALIIGMGTDGKSALSDKSLTTFSVNVLNRTCFTLVQLLCICKMKKQRTIIFYKDYFKEFFVKK